MACQCKGLDRLFEPPCCLASQCIKHQDQAGVCHHYRVVYTDGACANNGTLGAASGIGIAFGTENDRCFQFSIPVDDPIDPGGKRTSQRAELLAALQGLNKIADYDEGFFAHSSRTRRKGSDEPEIVITTDSEYVVKGVTEWLPVWKKNGMRKPNGQRPSNLDLFLKLDAEVVKREREHDCKVMFWYIERGYNTIADGLAQRGARDAAERAGH
ncbi:ribonuclease H-like domain-containing protein [Boletus edulis]|nr:ribonuclease H-like domain-containing protein [Boletus edulis]